jgi:hypothetical protein
MMAKLIVLQNGTPFFEYPIHVNEPGDLAEGAKKAFTEFSRLNQNVSLFDSAISIKFDKA